MKKIALISDKFNNGLWLQIETSLNIIVSMIKRNVSEIAFFFDFWTKITALFFN